MHLVSNTMHSCRRGSTPTARRVNSAEPYSRPAGGLNLCFAGRHLEVASECCSQGVSLPVRKPLLSPVWEEPEAGRPTWAGPGDGGPTLAAGVKAGDMGRKETAQKEGAHAGRWPWGCHPQARLHAAWGCPLCSSPTRVQPGAGAWKPSARSWCVLPAAAPAHGPSPS